MWKLLKIRHRCNYRGEFHKYVRSERGTRQLKELRLQKNIRVDDKSELIKCIGKEEETVAQDSNLILENEYLTSVNI